MGRLTQDQQLGNEFAVTAAENFLNELDGIIDPRRPQGTRYSLKSILLIALMAVICDINSAQGFELFGKYHEAKLSEFLDLPYGAPTQDVYLRVFAMLSETVLEKLFESQTYGTFPVNTPTPPLTMRFLLPSTSYLKPALGESIGLADIFTLVLRS